MGAEYIACTHCPIIVGAAAPTEPMVPTLMLHVIGVAKALKRYSRIAFTSADVVSLLVTMGRFNGQV